MFPLPLHAWLGFTAAYYHAGTLPKSVIFYTNPLLYLHKTQRILKGNRKCAQNMLSQALPLGYLNDPFPSLPYYSDFPVWSSGTTTLSLPIFPTSCHLTASKVCSPETVPSWFSPIPSFAAGCFSSRKNHTNSHFLYVFTCYDRMAGSKISNDYSSFLPPFSEASFVRDIPVVPTCYFSLVSRSQHPCPTKFLPFIRQFVLSHTTKTRSGVSASQSYRQALKTQYLSLVWFFKHIRLGKLPAPKYLQADRRLSRYPNYWFAPCKLLFSQNSS